MINEEILLLYHDGGQAYNYTKLHVIICLATFHSINSCLMKESVIIWHIQGHLKPYQF